MRAPGAGHGGDVGRARARAAAARRRRGRRRSAAPRRRRARPAPTPGRRARCHSVLQQAVVGEHDVQPAPGRRAPRRGTAARHRRDGSRQPHQPTAVGDQEARLARSCSQRRTAADDAPARSSRGSAARRPRTRRAAAASASSRARSGTTRWIASTRRPPGPIGVTRASTASLPGLARRGRGVGPRGGEAVVAVGDDRAGARAAPR